MYRNLIIILGLTYLIFIFFNLVKLILLNTLFNDDFWNLILIYKYLLIFIMTRRLLYIFLYFTLGFSMTMKLNIILIILEVLLIRIISIHILHLLCAQNRRRFNHNIWLLKLVKLLISLLKLLL